MDIGELIVTGIVVVGGGILSAISDSRAKKKASGERSTPQSDTVTDHICGALNAFMNADDDEYEEKPGMSTSPAPQSTENVATPTPIFSPASTMEAAVEGARSAADQVQVKEQETPEKKFSFSLHDKDSLRQAIILSDILPPKFLTGS